MKVRGIKTAFAVLLSGQAGFGQPIEEPRQWSGEHALTVPRGHSEIGLFSNARHGLSDRVELGLHPLLFFVLPHAEVKAHAARGERWAWGCRARLAYPTWFLSLVSREGSGGLLPKTSSPPQALQIEGDVIGTLLLGRDQLASVFLGLAVAPHESFTADELPLLDFPFLYPRFAPLYNGFVPRSTLAFEGPLFAGLHYMASARSYLMLELADVGTTYALEQALALEYRFARLAISLGVRASEAEYPVGFRVHYLPYFGVRVKR
jgi:hypothetical protein